jgi:hypothetical protein
MVRDQDTINRMVDKCTFNMTHFDISLLFYELHKRSFRYIGKNAWEYYDYDDGIWKKDIKRHRLKNSIKNDLAECFSSRYIYWLDKSFATTDINDDIHYKFMANKMLEINYHLKSNNFIFYVIKEAKSLFDIHNDD